MGSRGEGQRSPSSASAGRRKLEALLRRSEPPSPGYLESVKASSVPTTLYTLPSRPRADAEEVLSPPRRLPRLECSSRSKLKEFRRTIQAQEGSPGALADELMLLAEKLPAVGASAVDEFTVRHHTRSQSTNALLTSLTFDPTGMRLADTFEDELWSLRRNRFYDRSKMTASVSAPVLPPLIHAQRSKPRPKYLLEQSVWAARTAIPGGSRTAMSSGSRDFYETPELLGESFEADWQLTRRAHRGAVLKLILGSDHVRRKSAGNGQTASDVELEPSRVENEVKAVLISHQRVLVNSFDYYSCMDSKASTSGLGTNVVDIDIFNLSLPGYLRLCKDCKIESEDCPVSSLELIFAQVDSTDEDTIAIDRHNKQRLLDRQEYWQAIVRIAVEKYVRTMRCNTVADAIERLCRENFSRLPSIVLQNSNAFRAKHCFTARMDKALRRHMDSMRSIFQRYADLGALGLRTSDPALESAGLMSLGEWSAFISHLGLVPKGQLSQREARLIFSWSRLRRCADHSDASIRRFRQLSYEDFMEALVRLATLLALPTDEDLEETGAPDAGVYLTSLAADEPSAFHAFLAERRGSLTRAPRQPVWRCFDHMMNYIEKLIAINTHGGTMDTRVHQFATNRVSGKTLTESDQSAAVGQYKKSLLAVKQRLLDALRLVAVFASFSQEELERLRDAMSEAPFDEGDHVFEQGEEGDAFYVIIMGDAKVIRVDESKEERVLAELSEGDFFGERALLKDEVRYGTVRASTRLKTMCITRSIFESHFGPLQDLLGDGQYDSQ